MMDIKIAYHFKLDPDEMSDDKHNMYYIGTKMIEKELKK